MKTHRICLLSGCVAACLAQSASSQVIFSDNFESGNLNNWTASGASPLAIDNTQNTVPGGGSFSAYANLSLNRMHHNIIADNGGVELSGWSSFTAWIYDSTMTRPYVQALSYSGTGLPNGGTTADGSLSQLLAVGKYSSVTMAGEVYDATKYQARVLAGASSGWFNLNDPGAPSRSTGWHKFTIERLADDTTLNFYVDDILSRTITGATAGSWDTITMGFGTTSTSNGDAWYDGFALSIVPEPSAATFGLLGLLALALRSVSRRRKI